MIFKAGQFRIDDVRMNRAGTKPVDFSHTGPTEGEIQRLALVYMAQIATGWRDLSLSPVSSSCVLLLPSISIADRLKAVTALTSPLLAEAQPQTTPVMAGRLPPI